ncbi:ABC transporter permease [Nocardiopsis sp. RSe5-2]|uniref:ABC transporter permease n=1 Tax=Nocardiopsis endophytica TaxID=3018445 RepID=A0ABT4U6S6_9ACTN|nr:ABC transporter permease [Nocardiopsis endophytica]MDA2812649.1 ABC transporter permease [Nocardiopsis endophytica]
MSAIHAERVPAVRGALRRAAARDPLLAAAGCVAALAVAAAVAAPLIAPYDPAGVDQLEVFGPPSAAHWLGTDDLGRDVLSRIIHGARPTLAGPALVVLVSGVLGTALGVAAAWFGGRTDAVLSRALEVVLAFPGLVLAVIAAAVLGTGFAAPVVVLSIAYVPVLARVVRAAAIREAHLPYVEALRLQGASGPTICLRHLLPNLAPLILVQSTVGFGYALLDLAAVNFLGLGLQPPAAEWGLMIADGRSAVLGGHPGQALFPAAAVVAVVVSVNVLGERLADRFGLVEA